MTSPSDQRQHDDPHYPLEAFYDWWDRHAAQGELEGVNQADASMVWLDAWRWTIPATESLRAQLAQANAQIAELHEKRLAEHEQYDQWRIERDKLRAENEALRAVVDAAQRVDACLYGFQDAGAHMDRDGCLTRLNVALDQQAQPKTKEAMSVECGQADLAAGRSATFPSVDALIVDLEEPTQEMSQD